MGDNDPLELGFIVPAFRQGDDLFVEDDVGTWRCIGCRRDVAQVDEQGHASKCEPGERLKASGPKGDFRRRVVGEWPGLRAAILLDHDLRFNLVEEIVGAYRAEYRLALRRKAPWNLTRGATGAAFKALREHLEDLAPRMKELETLKTAALMWWSSTDKLDGRGGPPRGRKKGAIR